MNSLPRCSLPPAPFLSPPPATPSRCLQRAQSPCLPVPTRWGVSLRSLLASGPHVFSTLVHTLSAVPLTVAPSALLPAEWPADCLRGGAVVPCWPRNRTMQSNVCAQEWKNWEEEVSKEVL